MSIATKVVSSNPAQGEVYSIQHYLINVVTDLQQIGGFLWVLRFSLGTLVFSGYYGFLWVLQFSLGTLVFSGYSGFLRVLWFSLGTTVFSGYSGFLLVLWFALGTTVFSWYYSFLWVLRFLPLIKLTELSIKYT